jgi:hypothetical protein
MKTNLIALTGAFAALVASAGALRAAQTNITVVLTNQCQVTGFLVSRTASNVVVSVGGGQKMSFASSEISSLNLTEFLTPPSPGAAALAGGPQTSGSSTRIMLGLTNGSLVGGLLVSQSPSNFVVSTSGGESMNIARGKVSWFKLTASPSAPPAGAAARPGGPPLSGAGPDALEAEFNKPHTEEEMRAMLRTPEGAALVKNICQQIIGSGADAQTKAATETYFKTVQEFEEGKIGIVELQVSAQTALGNLSQRAGQTNDPQAAEWNDFKQILQGFIAQPAPAPAQPVQ